MIKPDELDSADGRVIWDTLVASATGDVAALRRLLDRHTQLSRAEYWYTPAIHFAAREGHADAVQILLDAGADPEWNGLHDRSLIDMARERGHTRVVQLLEDARDRRGRVVTQAADHPIHAAAERGDIDEVSRWLDGDADLAHRGDAWGGTPLHRAVLGGAHDMVALLLDRGANVHAVHSAARGLSGLSPDLQAIDLAIWGGRRRPPPDPRIARLLIAREAAYDLTVASALGDVEGVRTILDREPARIQDARPSGRRPLSAAVEFGHDDVVRMLLERGADPNWAEPGAPDGASLHAAAKSGNVAMVELLLAHGAAANARVDSSAGALFITSSPQIRSLLAARGATMEPDDLVWRGHDDDLMQLVNADRLSPPAIGAAFTAVCTLGKRELLARLLSAGARVPMVLTSCQTYLLDQADMLRMLLAHGMSPDLMNWQRQTLLHFASTGGDVDRAAILLDAGASLSARDDEYRSTPLAWAARTNAEPLVEFLLERGAPTSLPDDAPWATPLAWAERRRHAGIASRLRRSGADR